jgi:hypothetical protein
MATYRKACARHKGVYTLPIKRRHKQSVHLFQGCYAVILIGKGGCLLKIAHHVVLDLMRVKPMVWHIEDWLLSQLITINRCR